MSEVPLHPSQEAHTSRIQGESNRGELSVEKLPDRMESNRGELFIAIIPKCMGLDWTAHHTLRTLPTGVSRS